MGFQPKFAEGLVSNKHCESNQRFLSRFINSTWSIAKNMKRNSRQRVKHWPNAGTNSRNKRKLSDNKLKRQKKLNLKLRLLKKWKSNPKLSLKISLRKFQKLPQRRKNHYKSSISQSAPTTVTKQISIIGRSQSRMSMFKFHYPREQSLSNLSSQLNPNTSKLCWKVKMSHF